MLTPRLPQNLSHRRFIPHPRGISMLIAGLLFIGISGLAIGAHAPSAWAEESKTTPDQVYSVMDLSEQILQTLLQAKGIEPEQDLRLMEFNLSPIHAYQMAVAVIDLLIDYEKELGLRPMPNVVATPMDYTPADVKFLADMILAELQRVLSSLSVADFNQYPSRFTAKTPTDVFDISLSLFVKIGILADRERITPSQVYPQMVRAAADVRSILAHIDPARRYRIDAPVSPGGLTPADVFAECLKIRADINDLKEKMGLSVLTIPNIETDQKLHPADVFIQTQIIIAELNLLKMATGTISATPLAVPVSKKSPSDAHQQAGMVRYLLKQILSLQEMKKTLAGQ